MPDIETAKKYLSSGNYIGTAAYLWLLGKHKAESYTKNTSLTYTMHV
jgi:hypothetical protein